VALEGKIVDFGVADILQLISQQQKTGVLLVERGAERIEVLFWNGMIVSAHPVAKAEKDLLGEKLVLSGLVTEEQLHRALDVQGKNLQHIGEILVEFNMLGKDILDRIIRNQIYDTFSDLFQWKEGSYAFQPTLVNFNEKVFTPLGFEHIILDVLRMMDEWPGLLKRIDSMDAVFKKVEYADPAGMADVEAQLLEEQKIVYNFVDGSMTVSDLADRSLLGKFTTAQTLRELLDRECIERVEKNTLVSGTAKTWEQFLGPRLFIVGGYCILAMLVVSLMRMNPPDVKSTLSLLFPKPPVASVAANLEHNRVARIKNALQIYFWEHGAYPGGLERLVEVKLLQGKEILSSTGKPYHYSPQGHTYSLQSHPR